MIDNSDAWKKRAQEVLAMAGETGYGRGAESSQFAASMLTTLYGPQSQQMKQFQLGIAGIQKTAKDPRALDFMAHQHALGVIRNTLAELEGGLIVQLRIAVEGEVLGELIRVAREIMADRTDEAKNVGAVLSAAAYEGLLRRMAEEFAGVADRPRLEEVIGALKAADVLRGGQVATAQGYLKFRNDSLHADWKNVDRSLVESCLSFSESLLMKHFSG